MIISAATMMKGETRPPTIINLWMLKAFLTEPEIADLPSKHRCGGWWTVYRDIRYGFSNTKGAN